MRVILFLATRNGSSLSVQRRAFRSTPVCYLSEDNKELVSLRVYADERGVSITAARRLLNRAKVSITKLDSANEVIHRQSADEKVVAYMEATQFNRRKSAMKAAATRKKNKSFSLFLKTVEKKALEASQEVSVFIKDFLLSTLTQADGTPLEITIQSLADLIAHADSLKSHHAANLYASLLSVLKTNGTDPRKVVISTFTSKTDEKNQVETSVSVDSAKDLES